MRTRVEVVSNDTSGRKSAVAQGLRDVISKATFAVEAGAKVRAPVDTGALRNSIQGNIEPSGERGIVAVGVDYGAHVEFGTRHQQAQPYLLPALHAVTPQLAAELSRLKARLQ